MTYALSVAGTAYASKIIGISSHFVLDNRRGLCYAHNVNGNLATLAYMHNWAESEARMDENKQAAIELCEAYISMVKGFLVTCGPIAQNFLSAHLEDSYLLLNEITARD